MNRTLTAEQLKAEIPRVTTFCADTIRNAAHDDHAPRPRLRKMNAHELHQAAVNLTLKLIEVQELEGVGIEPTDALLNADEMAAMMPLIAVSATRSDRRRARVIAHELATEIQRSRVASELYDADTVECPTLDGRKVRHLIARRVEHLVCEPEPWDEVQ